MIDRLVKNKLYLILSIIVSFLLGVGLAYIVFGGKVTIVGDKLPEDVKGNVAEAIIQNKSGFSKESAESMLASLLSKDFEWNSKVRVQLNSFLTAWMREDEGSVMKTTDSPFFKNLDAEKKNVYSKILYAVLAENAPDKFLDYYETLPKDWGIRGYAMESFFERLISIDPKAAYEILSDEKMDMFSLSPPFSGYAVFGYTDLGSRYNRRLPPYEEKRNYLAMKIIEKVGLSDDSIVKRELDKANDDFVRGDILKALVKGIAPDQQAEAISWAKSSLGRKDMPVFYENLFDSMARYKSNLDELLSLAEAIGMDNLSEKNMDTLCVAAAGQDPMLAIDFIEKNVRKDMQEKALTSLVVLLNENYPSEKMLTVVESLPDGMAKDTVLPFFFKKYYTENPKDAVAWMEEKNEWRFFGDAVVIEVMRNPDAAKALIVETLKTQGDKREILLPSIQVWHATKTQKTGIAMMDELDGELKEKYRKEFYMEWMRVSPGEMVDFMQQNAYSTSEIIAIVNEGIGPDQIYSSPEMKIRVLSSIKEDSLLQVIVEHYVASNTDLELESILRGNMDYRIRDVLLTAIREKKNDPLWNPPPPANRRGNQNPSFRQQNQPLINLF